ncbi:hypothetical protein [Amycolatopsis sp. Hca4]|uniref:hypothetical protein n=1 Tax=Amycolatopsis sp. Hca4 TaxID=2742131 RepID=UPI001592079F|nr:hypothetical protein [Amycolatopsis sp. Hca4]QKV74103.1 hypothetical protein HUT10_10230 [Amycolatopsis sp. Hca4]
MTSGAPTVAVESELSPEFNRFVLGTGDTLQIADQLHPQAGAATALGAVAPEGILFTLSPGVVEVDIRVEVWDEEPPSFTREYLDTFTSEITPTQNPLQLTSISPGPSDRSLDLPEIRRYKVEAYVLSRETRRDEDFDLDVRAEQWVIRLW